MLVLCWTEISTSLRYHAIITWEFDLWGCSNAWRCAGCSTGTPHAVCDSALHDSIMQAASRLARVRALRGSLLQYKASSLVCSLKAYETATADGQHY